jgi:hypothetical protein
MKENKNTLHIYLNALLHIFIFHFLILNKLEIYLKFMYFIDLKLIN